MAIYFVDYENVGSAGIEGIDTLPAGNKVHIFYSVKADTMKMDQVIQLMRVAADVEFHDVTMRGQKNALDFQLIAMLYFTKKDEDTCYIISKDQGYDAAIIFGRKIGAEQVYRRVSINGENIGETKAPQQGRRSGRRGDAVKTGSQIPQQEQPVLLAERAQGVTTLPYQREYIRPPRKEASKAAELVKKEEPKAAEPVKKEEPKAAVPVKKEEPKAAEPVKKEEPKAAEPVKKEEPKAAEPVKKEEPKAAEPVKKEEPKAAEPAKKEETKTGIPNFRREVVVVKTVENTGRMQEKAAGPVKKEEPKAAEPVKKEEPKAAELVKKEEPKAAEPVKKEEPKTAEPVKKEEPAANTPAKQEAAEETGFLKAAAQWDIFQSSIGGLFDYDIPAEYADGEDEPVAIEALTEQNPEAAEPKAESAEPKAESAEPKAEKHSRQRKSRRRSQRQKAEEPVMQDVPKTENAPDTPAVEVKDDAPKASADEPKAEKPKKAAGRKKKEKKTSEETPKTGDNTKSAEKETAAAKDYKEIEKRVAEVMSAAGFALEPEENELIAKALVSSSTKNQFYQFFRKTKGEAAGREFYLKIRGQYESLKVLREA